MEYISFARIYAQLGPDYIGIQHLVEVQELLPPQKQGRLLPPEELHLSLIHMGDITALQNDMQRYTALTLPVFEHHLLQFVRAAEGLLLHFETTLQPIDLALFGSTTLAVRYMPNTSLTQLHTSLLKLLQEFLTNCGISDTEMFITNNRALRHAGSLTPHITLCKGYAGPLPTTKLSAVTLQPLPVRY